MKFKKYKITQSRLLYVMSINDRRHHHLLKVGEVFVDDHVAVNPDKQVLADAVRAILKDRPYLKGEIYQLEHVECTAYKQRTECYTADDVHRTLKAMGVPSVALAKCEKEDADIWFHASLNEVLSAIREIKEGRGAGHGVIVFRPEQKKAIDTTVKHFQKTKGKTFLWNAKMRFGKTLCSLEVAKRMGYKATLIITHRPVVDEGWHDDFEKIFGQLPQYVYATRMSDDDATGGDFYSLTRQVDAGSKRLVFFVSMQYLRLSQFVGGKERHFDPLKKAIMLYDWDFVMVDEAHEGIEAAAGVRVMEKLKKENTRILSLSGTPFNLLDKYEESEIYTWDYVMEQRAKQEWDEHHFGDPNPYADLPCMKILTFTLKKMVSGEAIDTKEGFKFHEFFRVGTDDDKLAEISIGKFVHEDAVKQFVKKLRTESETSLYPFSTNEFREKFRHTFWVLPGVKEAAALEEILKDDKVFGKNGKFRIINVAGDGNIEDKDGSALTEVIDNIRGNADKNITPAKRTITLSCGKLTTGVSVPEWTAVLCMKGSENTPAANYMQTIFRVQTHAKFGGSQKRECYVFDFAPERALTAVAETAKMAVYAQEEKGKKQLKLSKQKEELHLEAFIKLCPVLSMDEGEMGKPFSATKIFEKLNNVYIERAVRSGYADNSLYNPDKLLNLTPEQEKALGDVHDLLGSMPNAWKPEKITINKNGLGDTTGADQIKYVYCLSSGSTAPSRPILSADTDDTGGPTTHTEGWSDEMSVPTQAFPYLFVANTRLVDGTWTSFSQPVLWKEWINLDETTDETTDEAKKKRDEAKKKRDEENREKRARMSVLRGVAIRIPLLVYGAEINDEAGEEITIDNFANDDIVDDASWEEFMPKGFTKDTFNILKECFDRTIFTGAAKRIRQMVKEADNLKTEDRINKIATIFSYFHNPDKETVLTRWPVVNMHMSDTVGGWCFYNEEFDALNTEEDKNGEQVKKPRFVDRGDVTRDIFADYNARILEINSKTGLYPLYMAYSLFKGAKEPNYRRVKLTGERGESQNAEQYYRQAGDDLEIWKDVLKDNIFVVCRTKMAVSITKRTLAGFRKDIRMNIRCYEHDVPVTDLVSAGVLKAADEHVTKEGKTYFFNGYESLECDMINVLRAKPELFQNDIVRGNDFWHVYNTIPKSDNEDINNMKFSAIVGNPPYQLENESNRKSPIYHLFYNISFKLAERVTLITPARFLFRVGQTPKDWMDRMLKNPHFKVVKYFESSTEIFDNVEIKGGITYTFYDRNKEYTPIVFFSNYPELKNIYKKVCTSENMSKGNLSDIVSAQGIFKFTKLALDKFPIITKIQGKGTGTKITSKVFEAIPELFVKNFNPNSYQILGMTNTKREYRWVDSRFVEPINIINKYKVLVPQANGSGKLGEQLSSPVIAGPNVGHTDTFLSIGSFENKSEAVACLRYIKSKFARTMLGTLKVTQNTPSSAWSYVPLQDFTSLSDINWGEESKDIDRQLYTKYHLSDVEIAFIEKMIKPMD